MLRRQPPAHAPVPWTALRAGMQALVRPSRGSVEGVRQTLASFFGSRDVVLTSSGTAALTLAMRGARRIAGDAPVALPAYGCYDLATAAAGSGSRVVLYDLDPATLAPDTDSLRAAVSAGVSAAVVVHFYGIPVDLAPLDDVLSGTLVIEDAAQGAGARLRERPLGSSGSLGILSFGTTPDKRYWVAWRSRPERQQGGGTSRLRPPWLGSPIPRYTGRLRCCHFSILARRSTRSRLRQDPFRGRPERSSPTPGSWSRRRRRCEGRMPIGSNARSSWATPLLSFRSRQRHAPDMCGCRCLPGAGAFAQRACVPDDPWVSPRVIRARYRRSSNWRNAVRIRTASSAGRRSSATVW